MAAGAVLGQTGGGPLLLTDGRALDESIIGEVNYLVNEDEADVSTGLVFGGTNAISDDVYRDFASAF